MPPRGGTTGKVIMSVRGSNKFDLGLDLALLSGVLIGGNRLLAPGDLGWLGWNPTPYVLLPILLGSRYGVAGGLAGGLTAILIAGLGQYCQGDLSIPRLALAHYYTFGMQVAVGLLCGELYRALNRRQLQLTVLNEDLQARLKALDTDCGCWREAKDELERRLATRDAETCTLDTEIRRLYQTEGDDLYQGILGLLARQGQFSDAALYAAGEPNAPWRRKALLGNPEHLPLETHPAQWPIAALALERKEVATLPELWEKGDAQSKVHLLAQPLLDSQDQPLALLMVTGVRFMSFNRKTVRLINVISHWVSGVIEIKTRGQSLCRPLEGQPHRRIFHPPVFRRQVELAFASYRGHRLPSTLVVSYLPEEARARQDELERLIVPLTRAGDIPSTIAGQRAKVVVLLPLTSERGAAIFVNRVMAHCQQDGELGRLIRHRTITFENVENIAELWRRLES